MDFYEIFSPVVKPTAIRLTLSIAVTLNWTMKQLDIKNTFLHGFLKETVYMEQLLGFIDPTYASHVCQLNRALYGLKQSPCAWFDRLSKYLFDLGFSFSKANTSLFIYRHNVKIILLLVYVNDVIMIGNNYHLIQTFINKLDMEFALKALVHFTTFLESKLGPLLVAYFYPKISTQRMC